MTTSFTMFPTATGMLLPHTMLDTVFGVLHRLYDQFLFAWMLFITGCRKRLRALLQDDSGIGTIELVLILVVLIALVLIFKDRIKALLNDIFDQIESSASSVY